MIRVLALALTLLVSFAGGATPIQGALQAEDAPRTGALCQVQFSGLFGVPRPEGGHAPSWFSISVTHLVEQEAVETRLVGQLKRFTSSGALLALLASRLETAGAKVIRTRASEEATTGIFIEDVLSIRLDLPACQQVNVTFCDRPLGVLGLRSTGVSPAEGALEFFGVVRGVDGKTRTHQSLQVPILTSDSGHDVCKRLFDSALESGWLPVRPATDRWSPSRRQDARTLESTEIKLTASGWEIELVAG